MSERVLSQRELNRAVLARQRSWSAAECPFRRRWSELAGSRPRADYWPLTAAIRAERRAWWERTHKQADPKRARAAGKRLRVFLAGRPRRWKEIQERFGREDVLAAAQYVDLVRVPPSGTWEQRRADLYGLAEEWIGPDEADEQKGLELLVRRYLGGFGPATPAKVADFGMVSIARVRASLERMQLRRFRGEDGKELVDLPRAPLPDPDTPAPPRFLPVWDATLLVHARRTQILPEEHRTKVFNIKTPNSVNTFLVDGQGRRYLAIRARSDPDRAVRAHRAYGAKGARRGGRKACRVPPLGR